ARWHQERDQLVLTWEAGAFEPPPAPVVGPPAPPSTNPPARQQARGEGRIDLRTGRVRTAPAEAPAARPPLPKELEKKVLRWQGTAGKEFKALVLEEAGREQRVVLRSWDLPTGKEGPAKELARGKRLAVRPTLDERFLCVRDAVPSPDQKS